LVEGTGTFSFRLVLEQQVEDAEGALPVLRLGVFQVRIEDLEGAGEGHAQPAREFGQAGFGLVAIGEIERRQGRQAIEDGFQLDSLINGSERVNTLLQPLGDRQIEGFDDVATVRLRRSLAAKSS
jgi:hypothetical protein